MLFNIEINDQEVSARRGETILTVLNRNGIKVPTLCNMSGMTPTGSCRMCMVEVDGLHGLVPACSQPVEEWMKIRTHSSRVIRARKTLLELLLASHPDDCLYCDKNGHCELQVLSEELNVRERKYQQKRRPVQIDKTCPSVERNPAKCILCGRCIRICDTVMGVAAIDVTGRGSSSMIGTTQNKGLNYAGCVKCGQCIMVCPTGALSERSSVNRVFEALNNPELSTVIQFSPTAPGSIAEEFGLKPGKDALNLLRTALRMAGFKYILDTSFAADITIMEDAAAIVERLRKKERLPMFTATCPSFVHYIREFRPDLLPNLLPARSPQQIMGTLVRNYVIPPQARNPESVFSVSVMPCTAKKAEAEQEGRSGEKYRDVDAVLTIRELVKLIRLLGIDLASLEPDPTDTNHGIRSSAGKLYGVAGGGLEGTLRTVYQMMTSQELQPAKINDLRGMKEFKEYRLKIGKEFINTVAVSGLARAIRLLEEMEAGKARYDIIEVMACPYGCVNGGGQPFHADEKTLKARVKAIYDVDEEEMIKVAHKNPNIGLVYEKLFGTPGQHKGTGNDPYGPQSRIRIMSSSYRQQLVYTHKDRCRVCYTCLRECPVKAIKIINGQAEVVNDRCIGCGNCVKVCSQGAKYPLLSENEVWTLLRSDQQVAACVAPSFPAEFGEFEDHRILVGMIRKLGFDFVTEVSFGADIVAKQYENRIKDFPEEGDISSDCPAIVYFIRHYHPELVGYLAPIASPMVAMTRVLKQKHGAGPEGGFHRSLFCQKSRDGRSGRGDHFP